MMSVLYPRDLLPLCLMVLACTLVSGEEIHIGVNGLMTQSILLSLPEDPSSPVEKILWNFKTSTLLTYIHNQLHVIEDQFEGRLEMLDNGRKLRIGQLRLEDSGLYTGTIIFINKTKDKIIYNLTVYDPVSTPCIEIKEMKNTSDWCNVTLRCSNQSNASSLSYNWKYRQRGSAYQQYNNHGVTIQMSLPPESWDMEVMCIVENPADSKNNSLQKFCPNYSGSFKTVNSARKHILLFVPLVLIFALALFGLILYKMKRKRRKETPAATETINVEPQYIQVTTVQPSGDSQVLNNTLYETSPQQKPKVMTVYATLEHPPDDSNNTQMMRCIKKGTLAARKVLH
ncbi:CD48 antigen-like isoform 2-T2 [Mantella aurantiaca]